MSKRASGEGSIYQRRDGKWVGSVSVGWVEGQLKRRKVVAKTQAEAVTRLENLKANIADGGTVDAERRTVEAWLLEWLEKEAKPSVRPRTFETYRAMTRKHLIPALGHHRLRQLQPSHVRDYMRKKHETLTARTVEQHHAILRRALRVAESYGYVSRNVARLVSPPTVDNEERSPLTQSQVATFLTAVQGHRFEPLYRVAMATGVRQSELLGLRWSDVDFDGSTIRIERSIQWYRDGDGDDGPLTPHHDPVKTRKSRRKLAIAAPVVEALRQQQQRQQFERRAVGEAWKGDEWSLVFTAGDGSPLRPHSVTRAFNRVLRDAKLPPVHFHDLRHGVATFLLAAGVDLKVVQEILGHSTIHTTANVYAHVLPELQRDAAERVSSILFGKVGS